MTTKEMVMKVLQDHPCLTSSEIKCFVQRTFGATISPNSAAGVMRPLIACGLAGSSYNDKGKTVYWLHEEKRW